jgi:hypothetical protein
MGIGLSGKIAVANFEHHRLAHAVADSGSHASRRGGRTIPLCHACCCHSRENCEWHDFPHLRRPQMLLGAAGENELFCAQDPTVNPVATCAFSAAFVPEWQHFTCVVTERAPSMTVPGREAVARPLACRGYFTSKRRRTVTFPLARLLQSSCASPHLAGPGGLSRALTPRRHSTRSHGAAPAPAIPPAAAGGKSARGGQCAMIARNVTSKA